jgi:hypothetical protein
MLSLLYLVVGASVMDPLCLDGVEDADAYVLLLGEQCLITTMDYPERTPGPRSPDADPRRRTAEPPAC